MRIATRLSLIASCSAAAFVAMVLAILWTSIEFKDAKNDYALANRLKVGFFEQASLRDQYFLHRETRTATLWDRNKQASDLLLLEVKGLVHGEKDERNLETLRKSIEEGAAIFHRLVGNTAMLAMKDINHGTYEDLDKQLYSQLLLKAGMVRDLATALEESGARRVEQAYQRFTIIVSLFAVGFALVATVSSIQIGRFIRHRLVPLHAGARAVASGDLEYRLDSGTSDEFADLAQSLNAMTEKIQASTHQLQTEIAEREQAQDKLRQILREQEIILEHANVGISLIIDRKQVWMNSWMSETLQYSREEMEGQTTRKLYPSQEAFELLGREAYPALAKGETFETEQRLVRKDGQLLWIHFNGRAVDPSDLSKGALWILSDVTSKRMAEDALRESESRYHGLFDLSPDAICLTRLADQAILEVNQVWEQMFRCTRQEVLGRTTLELGLHHDLEQRTATFRNLETSGRLPVRRTTLHRKDGTILEAQIAASVIELEGEPTAMVVVRDVGEEIALRVQLDRQMARYSKVMSTTMDAIHVLDTSGRLREWNPAFLEHLGYTEEEAGHLNVFDWAILLTPERTPGVIASRIESPSSFEALHRRKDGAIRNVEIHAVGIILDGEQMLLASARDITGRKQAEAAQREALDRLRKIASRIPGVLYQYRLRPDGSSCFPYASEGLREITGISPEEVREDASKVFSMIHPDDIAGIVASIGASARSLTSWQHEFRVKFGDVTIRTVYGNAVPQREEDGSVLWHGFITDITKRKLAEMALRESEERFRAMFEQNQAPQLLIDPETGRILDANPSASVFYGYSLEQLRASSIPDLNVLPMEALRGKIDQARDRERGHFEFKHRLADGRLRDVDVYSSPIPMGSHTVLYSIIHDITDRKEAEASLHQLNQTLEQRVASELARRMDHERVLVHQSRLAAMGEMVGNIAHQWRQPLNTLAMVHANLNDARRHHELTDESLAESLQQAKDLVQKMSTTITDFIDFFRPGKAPTRFSLNRQAQEALKLVIPSLRYHQVSVDVQEGEEVWAIGHPNEFSQVLLNLFSNSREAIQSSGVPAGLIRIQISRENGNARLQFSDNGGGIRTVPIERIFEPYFTDKPAGTGLGLYMSRMILEQSMKGIIEAQNIPGGAMFSILLPLEESDHDPNQG